MMDNFKLTIDDINELFRVMPEAAQQAQLIVQKRVIDELEEELAGLRGTNGNGHKENGSYAESGTEALPLYKKGKAASKSSS